jgi:hypothetical protein
MGREKFFKGDFFNYIKIKNRKKWESEKTKQNLKRVKNKAHNIRRISPSISILYRQGFDNDHSEDRQSAAAQCSHLTTIARI